MWEVANHYDIGYSNTLEPLKHAVRQFDKFPYTKVAEVMQDDLRTQLKTYLGYKEIPYNREVSQMLYRLCYCYPTTIAIHDKLEEIKTSYKLFMDHQADLETKAFSQQFTPITDNVYHFPLQYLWIIWEYVYRLTTLLYTSRKRESVSALLHYLQKVRPNTIDDFDTVYCSDLMTILHLTHRHPEMTYAMKQALLTLEVFYPLAKRASRFPMDVKSKMIQLIDKDTYLFGEALLDETEERLKAGHFDAFTPRLQDEVRSPEEQFTLLLDYYKQYVSKGDKLRELLELTELVRQLPFDTITQHAEWVNLLSEIDSLTFKPNDPQLYLFS